MSRDKIVDFSSSNSIKTFAQKLKGKTLRDACEEEIELHSYKGKGNFGQILEKYYFGYEPNSNSEADFNEAGLELKSSPLKTLKNGEYRSKERLVLNIINYLDVHKEEFYSSSFYTKNAHLLLVFYLHEKELDILDYEIKIVDDWKYPREDLLIIQRDWEVINKKIKEGKAHELSEGDTYYLGACTKGSTALKSLRDQPFSDLKAKQRAYSLKQGYVNHIIAKLTEKDEGVYGKILDLSDSAINKYTRDLADKGDLTEVLNEPKVAYESRGSYEVARDPLEESVTSRFIPFYEKSITEIHSLLKLDINSSAKNYFASITNTILGLAKDQKIEEFEKADIIVKTVRLKENNLPKEDISFPAFEYEELVQENWDYSSFKDFLEKKFFFVFYQFNGDRLYLKKVKFWNMPYTDINIAKKVWERTVVVVSKGQIVKEVTDKGIRKSFFPKKTENYVSHVRPHAKNSNDTYPLPVKDSLTGVKEYTKHSFWLNGSYVKDEIYLTKEY